MKTIFSILFFSISLCGFSQVVDTLTISQAVQRTLATYPTIKQYDDELGIAAENLKMTKDVYLPTVSASVGYTYMDPISKVDLMERPISMGMHNNFSSGVSLSQLIWDFGKSDRKSVV